MLEAISHPLIDSSSKESFPGVSHFITACCCGILLYPLEGHGSSNCWPWARSSGLSWAISTDIWALLSGLTTKDVAPQKVLPNGREGWWKSAPNCKILKKGSGWKSLSQSWLRPWTRTLEIWISSQPWLWTSSSVSICLLPLPNVICLHCAVYKTLWGSNWLLLHSCATLLTTGC